MLSELNYSILNEYLNINILKEYTLLILQYKLSWIFFIQELNNKDK
jgi:hypothetical protein